MKKSKFFSVFCITLAVALVISSLPITSMENLVIAKDNYTHKIENYKDFVDVFRNTLKEKGDILSVEIDTKKTKVFSINVAFDYMYSHLPEASYLLKELTYKKFARYSSFRLDIVLKYNDDRVFSEIENLKLENDLTKISKKAVLSSIEKVVFKVSKEKGFDIYMEFENVLKRLPEIYYLMAEYGITSFGKGQDIIYEIKFKFNNNSLSNLKTVTSKEDFSNILKNSLENYSNDLLIKVLNYEENDYNISNLIDKVSFKYPGKCYGYKQSTVNIYGLGKDKILDFRLMYNFTKKESKDMNLIVEEKCIEIVNNLIDENMEDYEKELILHDYVVELTKFDIESVDKDDIPSSTRTIYGLLVNNMSVCEGYARTYKKLLDLVNIENYIVIGDAGGTPHVWNMVKIQGEFYHVDPTWDDPVLNNGKQRLSHKYFNVTDEFISKNHSWEKIEYYKCDTKTNSFIKVKGKIFEKFMREKYSRF